MKFRSFLTELEWFDNQIRKLVEGEEVLSHQPKDGRWANDMSSDRNYYYFNVDGDDCGTSEPCYKVTLSGDGGGNTGIAFSRKGSHSDQHKGVGMEVFKGVLKAIGEYVVAKKPRTLTWTAVEKSTPHPITGKIINKDARAAVYEKWATRHLFPDRYVGMDGTWIRRDVYDSEYTTHGYPPVPEGLSGSSPPGLKAKGLEEMQQKVIDNRDEINRRENERQEFARRAHREEMERRFEEFLRNPEINPQELKLGDFVSNTDQVGKIINFDSDRFNGHGSSLFFKVVWANEEGNIDEHDYSYSYRPSELKKETEESFRAKIQAAQEERRRREEERRRQEEERAERERQRIQGIINDPEVNPQGLKVGDMVYCDRLERTGKIQSITPGRYTPHHSHNVYARVEMADENGNIDSSDVMSLTLADLKKEEPHSAAERQQRAAEALQQALADPIKNPHRLAVGDDVVTIIQSNPESNQNGLLGKVRSFKVDRSGTLYVTVDFDDHGREVIGERNVGKPITIEFFRKATPETILAIQRRRHEPEIQQRIERGRRRHGAPEQYEQTPDEIVNHPSNPQHFKVGDYVKMSDNDWRNRGRAGIIVSMDPPNRWNDRVIAHVRFHGSRAANPTRVWSLDYLVRDTDSPQVQQLQARRQAAMDRTQRLAQFNPQNIEVGDEVTVTSGINRGKIGRVVGFRQSGANAYISAVDADNRNFTANIRVVTKNSGPTQAAATA